MDKLHIQLRFIKNIIFFHIYEITSPPWGFQSHNKWSSDPQPHNPAAIPAAPPKRQQNRGEEERGEEGRWVWSEQENQKGEEKIKDLKLLNLGLIRARKPEGSRSEQTRWVWVKR